MLDKKYISVVNAVLRVIPEEEISVAISKGQRDSSEKWEWGDRALLWIALALKSGIACTRDHVYTALSQVSGIPKRTLRHYADHALYFNPDIRELYEPMPYSHFMVAKTFGSDWQRILETSANYLEQYGKYPTAEWLEWKHSRNAEPVIEQDAKLERVTDQIDERCLDSMPERDMDNFTASIAQARQSFTRWHVSVNAMYEMLAVLPISSDSQRGLSEAMTDLMTEIEEAVKEISHKIPKGS